MTPVFLALSGNDLGSVKMCATERKHKLYGIMDLETRVSIRKVTIMVIIYNMVFFFFIIFFFQELYSK